MSHIKFEVPEMFHHLLDLAGQVTLFAKIAAQPVAQIYCLTYVEDVATAVSEEVNTRDHGYGTETFSDGDFLYLHSGKSYHVCN